MTTVLKGTFPVIPTPFHEDQSIDYPSFSQVINYIVNCQVDGVVFPGLASEYAQLSPQERLETTQLVGELTKGKVPFVVGASAATPEQAIEYAIAGANAGAVCAMVMAPASLAEDLSAMTDFFRTLAAKANIPIMLQNAPQPMGAGLAIDNVCEILNAVPEIHYVKEETMPCGQRIEQLLAQAPKSLIGIFGGAGGRYIVDELDRGALGTVPACELTEMHKLLVDAHASQNRKTVLDIYTKMMPVLNMQAVYRCSLTKTVLAQKGIIRSATVRVPGPEMDAKNTQELKELWSYIEQYMGPMEIN